MRIFISVLIIMNFFMPINDAIINGRIAKPGEYPFMGVLESDEWMCSGFLVSPEYFLTAIHCVEDRVIRKLSVRFGHDRSAPISDSGVQGIERKFSDGKDGIALLTLTVPQLSTIKPMGVASTASSLPHEAFALGYGRFLEDGEFKASTALRVVKVPIRNPTDCRKYYRELADEQHLCAGGFFWGQTRGDSGGPLIIEVDGGWKAIGLLNYAAMDPPLHTSLQPGLYTLLSPYYDWIQEQIKKNETSKVQQHFHQSEALSTLNQTLLPFGYLLQTFDPFTLIFLVFILYLLLFVVLRLRRYRRHQNVANFEE